MTDHWIGRCSTGSTSLDLEGDTVIVLVGDHGILLGERGWTGKISTALHPELIQVPLVVVDPERRRAGQDEPLPRVAPTTSARRCSSMSGVEAPEEMNGVDLVAACSAAAGRPSATLAYGGYSNSHYLRNDRWMLLRRQPHAQPRSLYDLQRDPGETRNLAQRHPRLVRELHEQRGRASRRAGCPSTGCQDDRRITSGAP